MEFGERPTGFGQFPGPPGSCPDRSLKTTMIYTHVLNRGGAPQGCLVPRHSPKDGLRFMQGRGQARPYIFTQQFKCDRAPGEVRLISVHFLSASR